MQTYTFGYGSGLGLSVILHHIKNDMTDGEKIKIESCRVMIVGEGHFADAVRRAVMESGFRNIMCVEAPTGSADIAVDVVMDGMTASFERAIPVVYPFDFIEGGAAMVVLPGDKPEIETQGDMRLWAAKYMSGYCSFWNVEGNDWLRIVLPRIERGEVAEQARETAACICGRILANIAVGRDVKHFPRFYLSRNLELV